MKQHLVTERHDSMAGERRLAGQDMLRMVAGAESSYAEGATMIRKGSVRLSETRTGAGQGGFTPEAPRALTADWAIAAPYVSNVSDFGHAPFDFPPRASNNKACRGFSVQ